MADGESGEAAVALPQQDRVAKAAGEHGADLGGEIETLVDLVGQFARRSGDFVALLIRQFRVA